MHGNEEEESIWVLQVVSYWVLMPVVLAIGVAVSSLGLHLLHKPQMRGLPATPYLKLLLSLDVAVLLVSVPNMITLNGCHLHSYNVALYFAHPFSTLFIGLQIFSHYIIVWLCYDRFLALWYFHRFQQMQHPRVMRFRIFFTALFCFAVSLCHLLDGEVVCETDVGEVEITKHSVGCEGGAWIIRDNLHQKEEGEAWQDGKLVAVFLLGMIVPMVLVLLFSSGIVVGMVSRRIQNTAATTRTRDQAYSTIYSTLALSLSFVITITAVTVYVSLYSKNVKHCHGSFRQEIFRMAFHFFVRLDHLIHILFLAINQTFRVELRTVLQASKNYLSNALTRLAQTICPSQQQLPETHSKEIVSDAHISTEESPQVTHIMVSASQEQPDGGTNNQSPGDGTVTVLHPQHASQSVAMDSERNLPE